MATIGLPISDVARGTGYQLIAANPVNSAANLPQRVAVIAEMNDANQSTSTAPVQITSRAQAAALYGWGSPMDIIFRILLPQNGGGISGIPIYAYPVLAASGAAANVQTITVTGTSSAATTLNILIAGRSFLEGGSYSVNIVSGSTPTVTAAAIAAMINATLGCPFTATASVGVVTLTSNWKGVSAADLNITMVPGANPAGVSYVVATSTAGSGAPSTIPATLAQFGMDWNTLVVTSWSVVASNTASLLAQYIAFNGNPNNETGQWAPMTMRPAQYLVGDCVDSTTSSADTVITAAALNDLTWVACPTPLSLGLPMEGAANYAVLAAQVFNDTPNIDIQTFVLPDMPGIAPGGANPQQSSNYNLRNALVAKGMSTVIYNNGVYYPQDFVGTYAPIGIPVPTYRYPRDINIDMNIEYKFANLQAAVIGNNQIANDVDVVAAPNVVKPKDVLAAIYAFADALVEQGLTTDAVSMKKSAVVTINPANRNRFDISFTYTRSGVVRVVSNVATINP